jgi:acetate kinase
MASTTGDSMQVDASPGAPATTGVLVLNCGSSSLKYAAFDIGAGDLERVLARGAVENIGAQAAQAKTHAAAVHATLDELDRKAFARPAVVGHRIVHGGPDRAAPARVDAALLAELEALVAFAPLHLPAEIDAMRAVGERWPDVPQVACFDTAFHRTLSEVAQRYAIPEALHRKGMRRYGFHGLSYEYVVSTLTSSVGAGALGRMVIAHLGSGASMAAVRDGRAVDTTMGFTPVGGLVMGTRPGDLDPGLIVHLVRGGLDAAALEDMMNRRAGLLALSGSTADVRDLVRRRGTDPRAALALDVFAWSARRWVGAMAASLGGVDTFVFTGGIGEHAAAVRADIAQGLDHLGIQLDEGRNARGEAVVSADGSRCTVRVVSTDEERMVARHAVEVVRSGTP